MKIIAFTGMPFSGKSEAVDIARQIGLPVVRMGDMVWEEVRKQQMELTSETVGRIAHDMRVEKGMNVWARRTIHKINQIINADLVVIDGVRNREEVEAFKHAFGPDFILISITASDEIRHQRAMNRNRIDDSLNKEEIKKRDRRELDWGIKLIMEQADITMENEGSLASFQKRIKDYFHLLT